MLLNQNDSVHMLGNFEIGPVESAVSVRFCQVQSS